jgi:hypothetical protein
VRDEVLSTAIADIRAFAEAADAIALQLRSSPAIMSRETLRASVRSAPPSFVENLHLVFHSNSAIVSSPGAQALWLTRLLHK